MKFKDPENIEAFPPYRKGEVILVRPTNADADDILPEDVPCRMLKTVHPSALSKRLGRLSEGCDDHAASFDRFLRYLTRNRVVKILDRADLKEKPSHLFQIDPSALNEPMPWKSEVDDDQEEKVFGVATSNARFFEVQAITWDEALDVANMRCDIGEKVAVLSTAVKGVKGKYHTVDFRGKT